MTTVSGTPNCATGVPGNIGDYQLGSSSIPLTSHSVSNASITRTNGQFPVYVVTKDSTGNVYIDGFFYGYTSIKTCVTPYLLVKAQMKAGDSWVYTDINGNTDVARVGYVNQTSSFTVTGTGPHGGQNISYQNVAQVNYGSTFSIFWAPGYGPVQSVNTIDSTNSLPNTWTAYTVTIFTVISAALSR